MNPTARHPALTLPQRPSSSVPTGRPRRATLALIAGGALALAPWLAAQPDCRSVLGAHFKPYTPESQFSWAGEVATIPAYLENRYANNSMLFGAIDFTARSKAHQFYVEGGMKRSTVDATAHSTTESVGSTTTETHVATETSAGTGKGKPSTAGTTQSTTTTSATANATATSATIATTSENDPKYGWREFYYQYRGEDIQVRAGLSTTRLGDYFLVNERALGLSYRQRFGRAALSAAAGSVGDFARMTDFCGTKRLTNLVDKEKYETVGEDFGDTSMAGAVLLWDLSRPAAAAEPAPKAAADEFALSADLAPRRTPTAWSLGQVGLLAYHERDRLAGENRTWVGALAQFELPLGCTLKAQGMYQDGHADALIVYGLAEKEFFWTNASNTSVHFGYFGKVNLGGRATFEASFSNLFKGEIMRMDAIDIPLMFAGVRHNFASKRKLYVQVQGVDQLQAENMKEVDLEVGADFFKRLRVVAIGSYIYSRATKERENYVAKMEVRLGF